MADRVNRSGVAAALQQSSSDLNDAKQTIVTALRNRLSNQLGGNASFNDMITLLNEAQSLNDELKGLEEKLEDDARRLLGRMKEMNDRLDDIFARG